MVTARATMQPNTGRPAPQAARPALAGLGSKPGWTNANFGRARQRRSLGRSFLPVFWREDRRSGGVRQRSHLASPGADIHFSSAPVCNRRQCAS